MSVFVDHSRAPAAGLSLEEAKLERQRRALSAVKSEALVRTRVENNVPGVRWLHETPVPNGIVHSVVENRFMPGMSLGMYDPGQITNYLPAELWNGQTFKLDRDGAWGDPDWSECVLAMEIEAADREALTRALKYLRLNVRSPLRVAARWLNTTDRELGKPLRVAVVVADPAHFGERDRYLLS